MLRAFPTAMAMKQGYLAAAGAYFLWGLFPIYWRLLRDVPSLQIMGHRIVWCVVFVCGSLMLRDGFGWLRRLSPRLLGMLCLSSLFIACNWWLYIWAVNTGHIVETSLGYFINPLVSVLLGVFVLDERLRRGQWLAVGVAALGVIYLTTQAGHVPWIALVLAFSFAGYGLVRKLAQVSAVEGLGVESSLLFVPALGILLWSEWNGTGRFGHVAWSHDVLLIAGGAITAVPLVLFAYGARRVPLSSLGILQYLAPSLQLACGIFLFGEPFTRVQQLGFGCIWLALLIYAIEGVFSATRLRPETA
jgi:chloramphenicol-sensitive protein RarD